MTQATADREDTEAATLEQTSETGNGFTDMLKSFADDEQGSPSTTSPAETTDASAKPDSDEPATTEETEAVPQEAEVDALAAALERIATLEANHKKYSDDVHGRVGLLEQVLKAQAKTPAGQKVRLTIEDFEDFGKEYEEFAKGQVLAVNKVLDRLELTGLSPEFTSGLIKDANTAAETAAEKRYARLRSEACREDLDETHPGWRDIIGLADKDVDDGGVPPETEYRRWLKAQPEDYQKRVNGAYSPVVVGRSLDKFHDWKNAQTKTQTPKPNSNPSPSGRLQRLSAAVTPLSTSTVDVPRKEKTGYQAMMESYKED